MCIRDSFTMGDMDSMLMALGKILNQEDSQRGIKGRERVVEKFNFDGNAAAFEKIYLEAIQLQD